MSNSRKVGTLPAWRVLCGACIAGALLAGVATPAWALKSDRDQPMHVESDALRYESQQQRSTFTGNVVVTKGSIIMRGDKLVVTQTDGGKDDAVMYGNPGKPAFYRQKRDGPGEQYVEGTGAEIDYDGKADIVKFIGNAEARRLDDGKLQDDIKGDVITLNNVTSVYTVDRDQAAGKAAAGDRVRATFAPRQPAGQAAPSTAAPAPAGAPLKPSKRLQGHGAGQ